MRSASQNGLARARGRDARKAKRTPKRHAAWISLNSASAHMPCVVWDLSEGGARLAAPRSHVLPAMFNLILAKDGKSQRLCRIAWRSESQVGVQFIQDANVDLDYPQTRSRAKVEAAKSQGPRPTQQEIMAGCSLSAPRRGRDTASGSERRHIAFSSFAFALAVLLTAATVVFAWASQKAGADPAWAGQVCNSAKNLGNHPELTGAAAALMALIYLSARGMER
jgi:hypothetical protein